jgi:uncharacterized protein (UPF0332 family)
MDGKEFLNLAQRLSQGRSEAEWRSASSRAYYAVFHAARDLLAGGGFLVPRGEQAHSYLWLRLSNCGDDGLAEAGVQLNDLRRHRNRADYDLHLTLGQNVALQNVQLAQTVARTLSVPRADPRFNSAMDTIKRYERDVLREVTWQPPASN